jgi:hypothetical protein
MAEAELLRRLERQSLQVLQVLEMKRAEIEILRERVRVFANLLRSHCRYCKTDQVHPLEVCELYPDEQAALAAGEEAYEHTG